MRFAWLQQQIPDYQSQIQQVPHPVALIRIAYNILFWIFLLPFVTDLDYSFGFVAFTIVIFVRMVANLYMNNVMKQTPADFDRFAFRLPN